MSEAEEINTASFFRIQTIGLNSLTEYVPQISDDEDDDNDGNVSERLQRIDDDGSESEDDDESSSSDYVSEVKKIIYTNDEINIENALLFNETLQMNLKELKSKLERMLQTCQQKYKANEKTIAKITDQSSTKKSQAMNTFYFCGQPYFKDAAAFPAPNTADYVARQRRELFPLSLEERNVFWMARDKIHLINGVKKQVLAHLRSKNNDKIRKLATKRRASDVLKIREGKWCLKRASMLIGWTIYFFHFALSQKAFKCNNGI